MADTDCKLAPPMRHTQDHCHRRSGNQHAGDAGCAAPGRRGHLPPELLARHADVAPGDHRRHPRRRSARQPARVAILQDLAGPKIRTGRLADSQPIALARGDRLTIRTGDAVGGPGEVFTTYAPLAASVVAGSAAAARRRPHRAARGRHRRRGDSDDGRARLAAGRAQGHHRARRRAALRRADGERRRGPARLASRPAWTWSRCPLSSTSRTCARRGP